MLRGSQLIGFGGGERAPIKAQFGGATSSTAGTSRSLSCNVKPGFLIIGISTDADLGSPSQPSCTVNGQGTATAILYKGQGNSPGSGMTLFKFSGNTTDGSQQFDFAFSNTQDSFILGVWSFESADGDDVLGSGFDIDTGGAMDTAITYTGALGSHVLHFMCTNTSVGSFTGEPGFTQDAFKDTGGGGGDHIGEFESGLGSDIAGAINGTCTGGNQMIAIYIEISGV